MLTFATFFRTATISSLLLVLAVGVTGCDLTGGRTANSKTATAFPQKPIKIIVYTKPGGPIDMTAQRFAELAQQHSDAVFVVQYKPGAGGILAMEHVLQSRADGYTLLACTKSNIAKMVSTGREDYVQDLDWIALLMTDPECVITRRDSPHSEWAERVRDGASRSDEQVWGGPARGGLDHVTAMQIWDRFKIPARWIPYASGDLAVQGLLAGEIDAYVGNPGDARGQPDLNVSVVSSHERLAQLPDTPTFGEFGFADLDDLNIWRGFALRKGCSPAVTAWYEKLFQKITNDDEWRATWEKDGIYVTYQSGAKFLETVETNRQEFRRYLQRLEMLPSAKSAVAAKWSQRKGLVGFFLILGAHAVGAMILSRRHRWNQYGHVVILTFLVSVCLLMFWETTRFPATERAQAAAVPRLWMTLIGVLSAWVFLDSRSAADTTTAKDGKVHLVALLALLLLAYVVSITIAGYYISTAVFLVATMLLLGERRGFVILGVSVAWLVFAYLTFSRLLYVPLPPERWFDLFSLLGPLGTHRTC